MAITDNWDGGHSCRILVAPQSKGCPSRNNISRARLRLIKRDYLIYVVISSSGMFDCESVESHGLDFLVRHRGEV
jgi:hypothetical protein